MRSTAHGVVAERGHEAVALTGWRLAAGKKEEWKEDRLLHPMSLEHGWATTVGRIERRSQGHTTRADRTRLLL
jgi:hypothetical protein